MKFDELYESLMLELKDSDSKLHKLVQNVFRGTYNQVSATEFGIDPGKYVYAAIFQNGDDHVMLTMDKDGDVVLEAGSKKGDRATKEFRDLDVARKYIRKELVPGLRIDIAIARLRGN